MTKPYAWLGALMLLLGAGCVQDGKIQEQKATLDYSGSGSGDHEKVAQCDQEGSVTGSGNVEDGELRVLLRDGQGQQIFDKTYKGEFTLDSTGVDGKAGEWTLRAERNGDDLVGDDFEGRYNFSLNC